VVQGKRSNYDIDVFAPILARVEQLAGRTYGGSWTSAADGAIRVIADHARTTAFLVADGVQPSNEGRGYVLRRIMRRAIRHGDQHLGLSTVFFPACVEAAVDAMRDAYPELEARRSFLVEVARHEEEAFRRTLQRGLVLIRQEMQRLAAAGEKTLGGEVVWDLHQTYGFPWDLTAVIAGEEGLGIDQAGFERLLEQERERASAGPLGQEKGISDAYMKLMGELPATRFLGYEGEGVAGAGTVLALLQGGVRVQTAKAGEEVEVVLDQTPFYGESGGQVGDTGTLSGPGGLVAVVTDTQKPVAPLTVHHATVKTGALAVGDRLELRVDGARRDRIRANHSATHLLHRALKEVLGDTVNQKGSVVSPESLRFDFSHFSPLTEAETDRVEDLVNGWIRENEAAVTREMKLEEARAAGAVALFGEKYGERVRVVAVHPASTELCGGTHVRRSGDIGLFTLVQESSVAAGVRRVTALTGAAAFEHLRAQERQLRQAAELFKAPPAELGKRIETAQRRVKELERKLEEARLEASSGAARDGEHVQELNGVKVLTQRVDPAEAGVLRQLADRYRDQLRSGVVGLGGQTADGKALILVAVTRDLVDRGFKAGDAVRAMAAEVGGKGGGKADLAQAGGTDPGKLDAAFQKLFEAVKALR
jgi:alanyl-tRNA synthetase